MREPGRPINLTAIQTGTVRERLARLRAEDCASQPDANASASAFLGTLANSGPGKDLQSVARKMREAARREQAIIALVGAEVVTSGNSPLVASLIERGYIDCVALDGSAALADFELTCFGNTDESPDSPRYGASREVGENFNQIINNGVSRGFGLGEFLGRSLMERAPRHSDLSVLVRSASKRIPATIHPIFGADPSQRFAAADAANLGKGARRDFLLLAGQIPALRGGGVVLDLWSGGLNGVFEQALAAASQTGQNAPDQWLFVSFAHSESRHRPPPSLQDASVTRVHGGPILLSLLTLAALAADAATV
jgi:hypothetical protein